MKTFKVGDKVKIPTIGTAYIRTSLEEIQESLFDYKLDYLYVCDVWEDGEIGLMRGDGKVFEQDLYHENDLEHYEESDDLPDNMDAGDLMYGKEEYSSTFNPDAHSSLIIDYDKHESLLIEAIENNKVESIEEAATIFEKVCFGDKSWDKVEEKNICYNSFVAGAKSDAARNYWYLQFQKEHGRS